MREKIALIIPAYNEELTIAQTITSFYREMSSLSIWVIDNNSNDNTQIIAKNTLRKLNCRGGIINEPIQGKARAIKTAFDKIDADIYIMVDGDNTYPASALRELINYIILGYDMVIGDRISNGSYSKINKRSYHVFGNGLVTFLVNFIYGEKLKDILSGYRAFNKRFVKNYPILVDGYELETDLTLFALQYKFKMKEHPIAYINRPEDSHSKLNTFSDGFKILLVIFKIFRYYKPLMFFFSTAAIISIAGLVIAIPVLMDWYKYKFIYHLPLALLATGLEVVSMILLSIGLVLDSISYHEKQKITLSVLKE